MCSVRAVRHEHCTFYLCGVCATNVAIARQIRETTRYTYTMKILLLQDIPKLGKKGDIVDVPGGYARNALFPRKHAVFADKTAIQAWNAQKEKKEKEKDLKKKAIQELIPKLREHVFEFRLKTGKEGEIFESLHDAAIQKAVAKFCALPEEDIAIRIKPIKQLGETKIPVLLGRGDDAVQTETAINVLPRE